MPPHRIVPIVEGDGEVEAVPLLLRRLFHDTKSRYEFEILRAKNANGRGNLTKDGGIEKFLKYAQLETNVAGIMVFLDADEDCAKDIALNIAGRAKELHMGVPVTVICPAHEYEAWFLASLDTISGVRIKGREGINSGTSYAGEVEEVRSVKGWLSRNMPEGRAYRETEDQVALTQLLDFALVHERSRSFRRLEHAIDEILNAIDNNYPHIITPS